ncbi:HAMP domain-containing protein [Paenibacillus athensensis]|uniref:Signal transduction histidine-protein kinase ArlS n=1 Tax=Paenibacillus athensensis TaxID=1967502 RepID=A0A4Y8QAG2_9BACL|nr:ATP-binding protein [Paenibacillus athensensis]MCD1257674.1 HAMP domain-containing protein [Paenibacillus athensensis]
MMTTLRNWIKRLPIKWKLMLGATCLIFILFASYNFAQYLVLKQWMLKQEKTALQMAMGQVEQRIQDKGLTTDTVQSAETQAFLKSIMGQNEMIRIIDSSGNPLVVVTNRFHADWLAPRVVSEPQSGETGYNEEHILVNRTPYPGLGTIEVASNLETFDHFSQTLLWVMGIGFLVATGISAISGLTIARQFMRPIRALSDAIRNVKRNGLRERVATLENGDELFNLAQLFNDLMDQLEASFRKQKQFVEDASHELRTPITILDGHLSLLNRWGKDDPAVLEESIEASVHEIRRLKGITEQLLTLTKLESRPILEALELIQLEPLVAQTVKRMEALHPEVLFAVHSCDLEDVSLAVSSLQLEQVLLIVLDNAVKYSTEVKRIEVELRRENGEAAVTVQDHGIGIPAEDLPSIFDRFYRVDKARNREIGGTGLGLAIAKQIVQNYRGVMTVDSTENKGTKVTITLPIS